MTKKKYRRYSPEFKRHALKRASEDGVTDKGDRLPMYHPATKLRSLSIPIKPNPPKDGDGKPQIDLRSWR